MTDPKPISLTQVDAGDYVGAGAPQPFVVVGDIPGAGGGSAVESVNGQTGEVTLDASDVGALADDYTPAWGDVTGKPTTFAPAAHAATLVNVAADATNGIAAGNLQVVLSALAARIEALEP